jgi:hypothetical protein
MHLKRDVCLMGHIVFGPIFRLYCFCRQWVILLDLLRVYRAKFFKQSMGARNRVGIGLSYRPARLHRLAELIPWNIPGLHKRLKIRALYTPH